MPSTALIDNIVFLVLSIFIAGSVLFGYRTFALPPGHYDYISCGENCEKLISESIRQRHHLLKIYKQKPHEGSDKNKGDPAIQAGAKDTSTVASNIGSSNEAIAWLITFPFYIARTTFYNALYRLSVFWGLPFGVVLSIFISFLIIAIALLAEKISPSRVLYGKGFFLATQMIFFLFTHGRLVVLSFSIVLLLYLFYLPDEEKNKLRNILLHLICFFCASLSTGIFFVVYIFYLVQVILQWHSLKVANRTMGIFIVTACFPLFCSAILKNLADFDFNLLAMTAHGQHVSSVNTIRGLIENSYKLFLYSVPLLSLIPGLKKIYFHSYFRSLSLCLAGGGLFLGPNFGHMLLVMNSVALKKFLLDGYLLKSEKSLIFLSEGRGERGGNGKSRSI